jgi:hypothetical protein
MSNLKHVGRLVNSRRKVIVAYRTIPGDARSCIVVQTESLDADMHDSLIKLVESPAGQNANELAEAMARTTIADGRILLAALHTTGKMFKISTAEVEMTPNTQDTILLSDLNELIAKSKGVTIDQLALTDPTNPQQPAVAPDTPVEAAVSPVDRAAQLRAQAAALLAEADTLDPVTSEEPTPAVPATKVSRAKKPPVKKQVNA